MAADTSSEKEKAPDIRRLLSPKSIAIIGASANPASMGARALATLRRFNYAGDIYPVNPKQDQIDGLPCVASVADLPKGVDAAIIAIPQAGV
ncbi:CoA-binding protein, partial [Actibacterium sp.]|uniref:CoA-binding protein n=1 Tax=Actibacterium sp. TaxID=1872125 RepID=UPI0035627798